jgi:hypothetical protein
MPTAYQTLGEKGEKLVVKHCICFRCKRKRTLRRLPPNFKCADNICDFCGYLAQVKTVTARNVDAAPKTIRGAAWNVIHERMQAGIYFPLFIVQINGRQKSIFYLPTDLQNEDMYVPRNPSTIKGRKNPWQGVVYDFRKNEGDFVRIL